MPNFYITASYQTPSGGMSWRYLTIAADTVEDAFAKAERRIGKQAASDLDMRATALEPGDIP